MDRLRLFVCLVVVCMAVESTPFNFSRPRSRVPFYCRRLKVDCQKSQGHACCKGVETITTTTTTTTSSPTTTSQISDSTTTTLSSTFLLTPLQPGLLSEEDRIQDSEGVSENIEVPEAEINLELKKSKPEEIAEISETTTENVENTINDNSLEEDGADDNVWDDNDDDEDDDGEVLLGQPSQISEVIVDPELNSVSTTTSTPTKYAPKFCIIIKFKCREGSQHACCKYPLPPKGLSEPVANKNPPRRITNRNRPSFPTNREQISTTKKPARRNKPSFLNRKRPSFFNRNRSSSTTTEQTSAEDDLQPQDGEEDEEEGAVKDNDAEIKEEQKKRKPSIYSPVRPNIFRRPASTAAPATTAQPHTTASSLFSRTGRPSFLNTLRNRNGLCNRINCKLSKNHRCCLKKEKEKEEKQKQEEKEKQDEKEENAETKNTVVGGNIDVTKENKGTNKNDQKDQEEEQKLKKIQEQEQAKEKEHEQEQSEEQEGQISDASADESDGQDNQQLFSVVTSVSSTETRVIRPSSSPMQSGEEEPVDEEEPIHDTFDNKEIEKEVQNQQSPVEVAQPTETTPNSEMTSHKPDAPVATSKKPAVRKPFFPLALKPEFVINVEPEEEVSSEVQEVESTTLRVFTQEPVTTSLKPEPSSLKPELSSLKPEPSSLKPEPSSLKPEPSSLKPEPTSLKPEPSSLKPEPSSLKPEPSSVKPEPSSLKPEPSSLKPELSSLKPEPSSVKPELSTQTTSMSEKITYSTEILNSENPETVSQEEPKYSSTEKPEMFSTTRPATALGLNPEYEYEYYYEYLDDPSGPPQYEYEYIYVDENGVPLPSSEQNFIQNNPQTISGFGGSALDPNQIAPRVSGGCFRFDCTQSPNHQCCSRKRKRQISVSEYPQLTVEDLSKLNQDSSNRITATVTRVEKSFSWLKKK